MPDTPSNTANSSHRLSPTARRRSQSRLIGVAVSGSISSALLTSLVPLFLLSLNASPFLIGLVATSEYLQRMGRVVGLQLMHRTGKAGIFFWGRLCSFPAGLALALLAFYGANGVWAAWIGLALFSARGLAYQAGNTAWWPLVQDNTASSGLGAFLTRMRLQQRLLELALPILIGWYLGSQPIAGDFGPLFALAVFSTCGGAFLVRQVAEQPLSPPGEGLVRRLRQALATSQMRAYTLFVMVRTAVLAATFPLWVVALTDWGLPVSYFVWMTPVQALGYVAGLHGWGSDGGPARQPGTADHHSVATSGHGTRLAPSAYRTPVDRTLGGGCLFALGRTGRRPSDGTVAGDDRRRLQRAPGRGILPCNVRLGTGRYCRRHRGWGLFPMVCGAGRSAGTAFLLVCSPVRVCCGLAAQYSAGRLPRANPRAPLLALVILEPPSYVA